MSQTETTRVLHIITRMIVGGAQENTLLSVEGLNKAGYEVTLATGLETGAEGELLRRARGTMRVIPVRDLCRNIRPLQDLRALLQLYRIIRAGRYHIVHTHSSKAGVLGRLAAKLAGTPIIVHTLHGLVFHNYQPWLANRLWRLIKKACGRITDHYISVSGVIQNKAVAAGIAPAENFTTVFSGMELDWFLRAKTDPAGTRRELGIPDDALVVGKIARFFSLKGHEQLLEAAPAVVQRYPRVRFLLVGDGILHERLRERARSLGILTNLVFTGLVDRERIPQMLAAMDLLVHTSLQEGLPRALVQALAMGKPCVSFDIDGAPEVVIPGKTGYLVEPGDTQGLAESICALLGDSEARCRMGEEGRRIVDPAFRAETMIQRISEVYQSMLARHSERLARFEAEDTRPRIEPRLAAPEL
jgi:glycosyltransferase involved in cell wall biosynthesis